MLHTSSRIKHEPVKDYSDNFITEKKNKNRKKYRYIDQLSNKHLSEEDNSSDLMRSIGDINEKD